MRLQDLEGLPSFALLAPGYGGPGWRLLRDLRPSGRDDARLAFAAYEDRAATVLRAGSEETVEPILGPPPALDPRPDPAGHADGVRAIREAIAAGDVYQVNLTVRARLQGATGPGLLAALCARGVPRLAAWVRLPGGPEFVCGSPELFFETGGGRVRAEPMKGTAPAGQGRALLASGKDRAELAMITDLVRNDLAPVCRPGTIEVPCARRLIDLPYAVQAVSDVTGTLLPGVGPLEVLDALHPGGSITGAPKRAAMDRIAALERSPRGPYCGALGRVDGDRSVFAILIRTATRRGSDWEYGTGGGIVWDSDPALEWDEVCVKAGALRCDARPSG